MIIDLLRKLPSFKGKKRLTRFFYASKIENGRDLIVRGKYDCLYKLPNLKESVALDIFVNGIYEPETHHFLLKRLGQGAVLLDLGANIGSITIPLCKRRPDIFSCCVEASPRVADYLEKNISLNTMENVAVVRRALYTTDDQILKFYSPTEQFGKGSLSPRFIAEGVDVRTIKVDTLVSQRKLTRVGLIKIDVEGFEYFAFKGAEKLLGGEDAPDILFEFADWAENQAHEIKAGAAQQLLRKYGYQLYLFNNDSSLTHLPETLTSGNYMLFASKKKQKT